MSMLLFMIKGSLKKILAFNVTCNDISVTHVTAQMCRRTEEVVPTVGLPTPSHFARFFEMPVNCSVHARTPGSVQEPEVRPGAREESASPAWLATPAKDAHNPANIYVHV